MAQSASDILNTAANIVRRQDLDRTLLLFFLNTARRTVLRDKPVRRFYQILPNVDMTNGVIDLNALSIKRLVTVEWQVTNPDGTVTNSFMQPVFTYEQAEHRFGTLTTMGTPTGYLEVGTTITILPIPNGTGQINLYGEVWPADLIDSTSSVDITTTEIPEALSYLCAAEYFDMLAENDKAQYWRQKGTAIIDSYIGQLQSMDYERIDAWKRHPFNRHVPYYPYGRDSTTYQGFTVNDLDMGEWD